MNIEEQKIKKSYLKEDFRLFHLIDKGYMEFSSHYHDFNKIIVTISGNVTYYIEGKAYHLKPWDILIVNNSEVHRVIIEPGDLYERIILWINPFFIEKHSTNKCNLQTCFDISLKKDFNLIRLDIAKLNPLRSILLNLDQVFNCEGFGNKILENSIFIQFIVMLNRVYLSLQKQDCPPYFSPDVIKDPTTDKILKYINENLSENLSIQVLSENFFMSRYYFMHKFKANTGYTVYNYILKKRLIKVNRLVKEGMSLGEASEQSGFRDYSSFVRAFKKHFLLSPREYYKSIDKFILSNENNDHFIE